MRYKILLVNSFDEIFTCRNFKELVQFYDCFGMPIEFIQQSQPTGRSNDTLFKLTMSYDGSGRRISKTRWVKKVGSQDWEKELVTHYTGIGTEIRESFTGPAAETKVVVNMPKVSAATESRTPRTRSGASPLMKTGSLPPGAP